MSPADLNTLLVQFINAMLAGNMVVGTTTLSEAELAVLDGVTAGSATASKALVTNASNNISSINGLTVVDFLNGGRFVLATGLGTSGSANTMQTVTNVTTAIADNTATAVCTFTVPNAAHAAVARITILGSLGAGGAIGANEATGGVSYNVAITRTAGLDTVVTVSTAYGSAMANVAGAATITVVAAASAMSGLASATQTFTINATINSGSGSSANHTALTWIELMNSNASGVTVT